MMLAEKIYNLESFQKQYHALQVLSVCETIPKLVWHNDKNELLSQINWNNLLGIASILSYSDNNIHLDAALRISQTCLQQVSTNEKQKSAAAIILESLTNKPSIQLAIQRNLLDNEYKDNLPIPFKIQSMRLDFENCIIINDKPIYLNKFQRKVYQAYYENEILSISAPTSAGKSFILCTLLLEDILSNKSNIVYLVPTRALISQVESDLRELFKTNNVSGVNITTVPQSDIDDEHSNVFVFTQERLHWFLIENSEVQIDLLFVDEAQKIDDSNRGILLQQKIEEVSLNNPNIRIYYSSPYTSNPEILLNTSGPSNKKNIVNTQFVSVNQNLIYANQFPRKRNKWDLSLCLVDKKIYLGYISLHDRPDTEMKKLSYISEAFSGENSCNIIYSNTAAESEKVALLLYELIEDESDSSEIIELKKLVQKVIHKDYTLAKVLMKQIAFHYGNMPLLIRQEIERLFRDGIIKYLICTSTLLEGVNLPAKSIFIRQPTRGRNNPLNENDFWNLAGRAGRWGKEYSGNIICIEPDNWEIKPNPQKTKQIIKIAIDEIEKNPEELLNYIRDRSPRFEASEKQDLEFAFGYFYIKYLYGQLTPSNGFYSDLNVEYEQIKKDITIPKHIKKRNPGISPLAQQDLYNYFENHIDEIENLIPVYPDDVDAVNEYMTLIGRIGKIISNYPYQLNYPRAILLVNWMNGKPLSYLISSSYDWYQRNEKYKNEKKLSVVIREVMDNIEKFVRFSFAKDSSCYIDILRFFLEMRNQQELISQIPQLNLWVEFGVSQKTHLSLLSMGLSRNTVIELTQYIPNTEMTKDECYVWLKEQNLEQLELSPIIIDEILRVIS